MREGGPGATFFVNTDYSKPAGLAVKCPWHSGCIDSLGGFSIALSVGVVDDDDDDNNLCLGDGFYGSAFWFFFLVFLCREYI